jgi:hypothetical protein
MDLSARAFLLMVAMAMGLSRLLAQGTTGNCPINLAGPNVFVERD